MELLLDVGGELRRLQRNPVVTTMWWVSSLRFEWDPRKAEQNARKYRVTFEDAQTAFFDEDGLVMADPDRSHEEERFILLGATSTAKLVVVCHCYRGRDDVIRLISARRAKRHEHATYRTRSSQ